MPNLAPQSDLHAGVLLTAETNDWYALHTRTRFERRICKQVQLKRHEAYVPVTRARHRWSDRYQTVETPIFPGYVFVRATSDSNVRMAILQTNGVYDFVAFNGVIARITEAQINDVRRVEKRMPCLVALSVPRSPSAYTHCWWVSRWTGRDFLRSAAGSSSSRFSRCSVRSRSTSGPHIELA